MGKTVRVLLELGLVATGAFIVQHPELASYYASVGKDQVRGYHPTEHKVGSNKY